ncbi:NERD domain-containing protein [Lentibacillus sp.]|uniref:NERD domain-containing protein n=1 Tax=Lentibacillus sp. TaxID=1925746 RepID=UPI002B4AB1D5|nr:NERD domain-containing protein [Lentibacillus sp.]HLS09413.1 NERD domain-containing protein [Lentibacillus sp.]
MAQLIKLEDYISRYEWNAYRYSSQFIRIKQDNWKRLYNMWLNDDIPVKPKEEPVSAFSKWKSFLKSGRVKEETTTQEDYSLPKTEKALKHYFLNKLFPLQLKWASSTVTDVSFMDKNYYENNQLKYYLQRFPDTYLLMYYPIFNIKNAPVDGDIILISPIGIEIIHMIDKAPGTVIMADGERTWLLKDQTKKETTMLSPTLALKRTEQIVKSILSLQDIDFPVRKVVLSRTNDIVFYTEPYNTRLIGKHEYANWFIEKRELVSPLKNLQLKTAASLLKNCQTSSVKRPEWEDDDDSSFTDDNGEI